MSHVCPGSNRLPWGSRAEAFLFRGRRRFHGRNSWPSSVPVSDDAPPAVVVALREGEGRGREASASTCICEVFFHRHTSLMNTLESTLRFNFLAAVAVLWEEDRRRELDATAKILSRATTAKH
jgi:hypothetical protein